ncbi:MAG: invasin domain 3-containing protein, partial [Desulfobacterales bacterium]|nr:invasin domain 3-containing protein [Desulfobacterales bacterium]
MSEVDSSSITPDTINILSTENLSSDYINPGDSSNVYATVYSANGNTIAGQSVLFTLDNPTLGFITSSAATDGSGVAAATFTARSRTGQVQITATAGTIENDQVFTINIIETAVAKSIELSASPQELIVRGTSTITATVKDAQGALVQNGTTVNFDVENTESGTISVSATTNGGVATATFQASVTPGIATIVASSGTASRTIPVTVSDAPSPSIEFDSADPQTVALQ